MSRFRRRTAVAYRRFLAAAVVIGFATPLVAPASSAVADTSLGGYSASAEASSVRIAIYEPALPLPASPQVDASFGYARSSTNTGPSSQALASYFWPGDAVGNGIGTLAGNPNVTYPVQVTSAYPAVANSPANNTAQLTDGNGMTTSADGETTQATTTGLGLGSNLTSGIGSGLCTLLNPKCTSTKVGYDLPPTLAAIASMQNVQSQSTIKLAGSDITATASSKVSGLSLLAGLITISHVDMSAVSTSNGTKASDQGAAKIVGLKVAGQAIDLGNPVSVAGTKTTLPTVPLDLGAIGVKVEYLTSAGTQASTSASRNVTGLTITINLGVLGKALNGNALSNALAPLLSQIPNAGPILIGLAKLGTKMVITVGDVRTSASGTPAYVGPAGNPGGPSGGSGTGSVPPASSGGLPSITPGTTNVPPTTTPQTTTPGTTQPAAFQFPGLGKTSSMLLLGCLVLAGLVGWLFRAFGTLMLGGEDCAMGLAVGVPNLREG